MMRFFQVVIVLCCTTFLLTAQTSSKPLTLTISGELYNLPSDSVFFSYNSGAGIVDLHQEEVDKKGKFSFKVSVPNPDYYIFRLSDGQSINIIAEKNSSIKVYGDGKNLFMHSNIVGSESSTALSEFLRYNMTYNQKLDSARNYLKENPGKEREVNASFQTVFNEFNAFRTQFMSEQANSPALIGVVSTFNLEKEFAQYEQVINTLAKSFSQSPTIQRLVQEKEANKKKMAAQAPLAPGKEAQEIAMENPDGDIMKLSDLKGKVVLLDFWASWCGPCRKENPHVVKLYQKYKDDGFDIFSVSLDKDKKRWIDAIEKDGLTWESHVSDLQGWQNAASKAYGVSSIPFTVLLDREGNIINTRLRGAQLEATLESIFGY